MTKRAKIPAHVRARMGKGRRWWRHIFPLRRRSDAGDSVQRSMGGFTSHHISYRSAHRDGPLSDAARRAWWIAGALVVAAGAALIAAARG